MKTNGFNIQNTHMTLMDRLMKLVTIALFLASLCWLIQKCPFKKTVGAPLYSYFTRGAQNPQTRPSKLF